MDTQPLADLLARRLVEEGHSLDGPIAMAELQQRLIPYRLCRAELRFATKAEYDLALLHLLADEKQAEIQEGRLGEAIQSELLSAEPALRFLRRFAASEVKLKADVPNGKAQSAESSAGAKNGAGSVKGPRLHGKEPEAKKGPQRRKAQWPPPDETETPAESEVDEPAAEPAAQPAPRAKTKSAPAATPKSAPAPAATPKSGSGSTPKSGSGSARSQRTARRRQPGKRGPASAAASQGCRSCQEELPDVPDLRFCPHCGTDQNQWDCDECQTEIQRPWQFCPKCGAAQSAG